MLAQQGMARRVTVSVSLIHEEDTFRRDIIFTNAARFGFVNPLTVELFLWDLELAAQLQKNSYQPIFLQGNGSQESTEEFTELGLMWFLRLSI